MVKFAHFPMRARSEILPFPRQGKGTNTQMGNDCLPADSEVVATMMVAIAFTKEIISFAILILDYEASLTMETLLERGPRTS